MAKVLYIKANPKENDDSITFQMSERFMDEYRKGNPEDEIVTLDLYKEDVRFLTGRDLIDMFSGQDFDVRQRAIEFAGADKVVVAAPFWNLSIPAILKAYIDYVTFVGITFKYTESGPVGLLAGLNKKVAYIVARGGAYAAEPMASFEMGERYLRTIMGFLGIDDFRAITCEQTGVLQGDDLSSAVRNAVNQAAEAGKRF